MGEHAPGHYTPYQCYKLPAASISPYHRYRVFMYVKRLCCMLKEENMLYHILTKLRGETVVRSR